LEDQIEFTHGNRKAVTIATNPKVVSDLEDQIESTHGNLKAMTITTNPKVVSDFGGSNRIHPWQPENNPFHVGTE
jgi:hypothetical protein